MFSLCELGVSDLIIVYLELDMTDSYPELEMMKCGCPPQDEINSFLECSDWAKYLSVKAIETLKVLLDVEHVHYRNRLEQVEYHLCLSGKFMFDVPIGLINYN